MTDARGTPVGVIVSAANEHDVRFILPLVLLKLPCIGGLPGRPRQRPKRVRADQGYTSQDVLRLLSACGIEAEIPQRGEETPRGLGKRRWPVERAISWLKQYRRVGTRRDRKLINYQSYVTLACAIIAFKQLVF
jgi:transposase